MTDSLVRLDLDPSVEWFEPIVVVRPMAVRIGAGSRVDSFVKLEGGQGLEIGRHVHVASFVHLNIGGGRTVIGDYAACASGAKVVSGSNQPEGVSMSASAPPEMQRVARSTVVIGPYAFLGTNCTVLPGVTVGEGAVIGAGAVVTKTVPPWEIWVGAPARKIGVRTRAAASVGFGAAPYSDEFVRYTEEMK